MRNKILLPLAVAVIIGFMSCSSNNPENNGNSTPIDSTNLNGTAPATYGADNPNTDPGTVDAPDTNTTLRANTASSDDSAKGKVQ